MQKPKRHVKDLNRLEKEFGSLIRVYSKKKPKSKILPWRSICSKCAMDNGAVWPLGHVATFWQGTCEVCKESKGLCDVTDWNWPPKAKVDLSSGREF